MPVVPRLRVRLATRTLTVKVRCVGGPTSAQALAQFPRNGYHGKEGPVSTGSSASPDELRDLLGILPDLIVLIDRDRRIRYSNRGESGYTQEGVLGMDAAEFVASDWRERYRALIKQVWETGETASFELPINDAQGETRWYEGTLTPIPEAERAEAVAIITRDVTERHKVEEEVQLLRRVVPVCSWCRKILDEEGNWRQLEEYVEETEKSRVTHGMCPDCANSMVDRPQGESA